MPVAREDMVKGYEFAKDQYVMFTPEELKAMEEAGTHMAEITEFVPLESIDPVYFDKAYYLAPDKGGAKPYALLASALRESKRCALGRWAARGKQYIVMIRPVEDGLVMQQLLYAGEVRSMKDLEIPKTEVKPAELKLAQQLIEQQASETFDPVAYTDEVRARIEAAVQKKVEGQEITLAEAPEGGRAGHRPHGSAAREPREEGARAGARSRAKRAKPAGTRKPPKRAQAGRGAGRAQSCAKKALASVGPAAMHRYGVRDVEKLLRLPRSTIRALVAAGFVVARARAARRLAVLVPGPDRAAHRAGAGRGEGARSGGSRRSVQGAAPPPARSDAAVGTEHRRRGRPRRRARGRQPLAGGVRAVPARVRRRSRRRLVERDRAPRRRRAAERRAGDWFAEGVALETRGRRGRAAGLRARHRRRSRRSSSAHQSGPAAARSRGASRRPSASTARRSRRCGDDPVLLYNLGVLLDDMDRAPEAMRRVRGGAARRSRPRRLPLQPGAAVRKAPEAEGRHPAHGAVSPADCEPNRNS